MVNRKTNTKHNNNKKKKEKLPLKEGQLILLEMPQYNKAKQKTSDWKPNWIAKIEDNKAIIIPLSTQNYKKPEWQAPIKSKGTNKNSWLQLNSGMTYTINKWGELNQAYCTLEQLPEETNELLWKQALKWSKENPWWILKDAE